MKYNILFFCLLNLLFFGSVHAQDNCVQLLSQAEARYAEGKLYDIPALLTTCLEGGFTKEQSINAYRLLTLSYLYLNYYEKANESYLQLLRLSPEYKPNEQIDPVELLNHSEKFTTKPIFYITPVKLGFNFTLINILNDYSISQSGDNSGRYNSQLGFHLGFGAEMVAHSNVHIAAEFLITGERVTITDRHWDFYSTSMDIVHTWVELPVMVKYNFFRGKVNPFISGGISPSVLASSSIQNILGSYRVPADNNLGYEDFPVQPRPTVGTGEFKNGFNYSLLFGGGFNYKIGLNYLVFEARYSNRMLNVTNTENRWREDLPAGRDLKFPTGHVDDDFRTGNLSFMVGFVKPLYKPRKIK